MQFALSVSKKKNNFDYIKMIIINNEDTSFHIDINIKVVNNSH